jgi:hypothetical protein
MITTLECICADGTALHPTYVFPGKGKSVQQSWVENDPLPAAGYSISESGWSNQEIGRHWIEKVFQPATQHLEDGAPQLLILDGHTSHVSIEFIEFAVEHNIEILCLPSHSSNELQPLDLAVFSPVATAWSQEVDKFSATGVAIAQADFCKSVITDIIQQM